MNVLHANHSPSPTDSATKEDFASVAAAYGMGREQLQLGLEPATSPAATPASSTLTGPSFEAAAEAVQLLMLGQALRGRVADDLPDNARQLLTGTELPLQVWVVCPFGLYVRVCGGGGRAGE